MEKIVSPKVLKSWLSDNQEIAFIDVREIGQHTKGHPLFSISIPYSSLELDIENLIPNKNTRVILIDNNDGICILAYKKASKLGYINIFILEGGIQEWTKNGYELFDGINVPSKSFGELIEKHFHTPSITAQELFQKQKNNENYVVIDGRPLEEYIKMSIPNSICCPNAELAYRVSSYVMDNKTEIIINCAGRTRSIIGAQTLIDFGIKNNVKALENGTQGWFLSNLDLEYNKNNFLDISPNEIEFKNLQNQIFKSIKKNNIDLIDIPKAQELILDEKRSTFIFNVTNSKMNKYLDPLIRHVPGGQLVQATDKYIGVWRSTLILVDDGDCVRAGTTAIWLKKMGFNVFILKDSLSQTSKLKFNTEVFFKSGKLNILETADLKNQLNTTFYDIRSSKDFIKQRIKNSIWLNRSNFHKENIKENDQILLITDNYDKAGLIAQDIKDLNLGCSIKVFKWNEHELKNLPNFFDQELKILSDNDCIDFNFHTYQRHEGNKSHAEQYLKWEIDLIDRMDTQELKFFRIF